MRLQFRMVVSRCATVMVVNRALPCRPSSASWTCRSLSLSRALVASSSSKILGSLTRARAIAIRCFWPPLSCTPPSPTSVSYCLGKRVIKLWACAALAASATASSEASGSPCLMFRLMVPAKSTGSCPTYPICERYHLRLSPRMSWPSRQTAPSRGS
mmetsp:Transcript_12835/g.21024  ORF Transcript_12835/g.21024 Transcript_12835/m.21024 type:complete len:157 (-) Transcript_12835:1488-1958(-)